MSGGNLEPVQAAPAAVVERRQNLRLRAIVDDVGVAISAQLGALMEAQGLSLARLADKAGVSKTTVVAVLKGQSVTTATLCAMADALGCEYRPQFVPRQKSGPIPPR